MNFKSTGLPILTLLVGVILLSIFVSTMVVLLYGPSSTERTVIVEQPYWRNYRGWWGHYGAGLPGWGGPKFPPPPSPHPKPPMPPPPANPPPANPAPANPPPQNPPA